MGRSAYFPKGVVRMRADRYEALLDFLLEAVSDDRTTPFPAHVLAGLRRAGPMRDGLLSRVESGEATGVLVCRR